MYWRMIGERVERLAALLPEDRPSWPSAERRLEWTWHDEPA